MKKVFTILAAVLLTACVFAQSPEKMVKFYVPLVVAAHLERWGVSNTNIVELDWLMVTQVDDTNLIIKVAVL